MRRGADLFLVLVVLLHYCNSQEILFPITQPEEALENALDAAVEKDMLNRQSNQFYQEKLNLLPNKCTTSSGSPGTCGRIWQCPFLIPYARKLSNPANFRIIKRYICSVRGRAVYLCCPNVRQPTQGARPTSSSSGSSSTNRPVFFPPARPASTARPTSTNRPRRVFPPTRPASTARPTSTNRPRRVFPSRPASTARPFFPSSPPSPSTITNGGVNSINPGECGLANSVRIFGGQALDPGTFPWLAAVGVPGRSGSFRGACGGALITQRHVLTAAHCFINSRLTHVRLGEHDLNSNADGALPRDFRIARHTNPGYDTKTNTKDIELITLATTVTYTEFMRPICLPTTPELSNNNFNGKQFTIVGWGRTEEGRTSRIPLFARVQNVPINRCIAQYADVLKIDPQQHICAAFPGIDACQGDSGGPLQYLSQETGRFYAVGLVSFGRGCAIPDTSGVYSKLTTFMPWITRNLR